ncbi:MAG: hypothetical protein Q7S80_02705 [bacterium]|nr:hypothetical protein [bacterium]
MSTWLKYALLIIITVGIVGGGTYYMLNKNATTDKKNLQTQIDDLNKKITEANTVLTAAQTAGWKTYTDTTYNYSFKYPNTWTAGAQSNNAKVIYFGTVGGDSTIPNSGDFMIENDRQTMPTEANNYTIAGISAYKAPIAPGPNGGAASIFFSRKSINYVLTMQTYNKPDNSTILDQIVSTWQFTK